MFNFFKFTPQNQNDFNIKNPTNPTQPKYNKNNQINFSLQKNVEVLKELLHFPDTNDLIFRFFDVNINNQKYNALILFYDGFTNSELINDYLMRQLMSDIQIETPQNKSLIKNKNQLNIKDAILREYSCPMSSKFRRYLF